MVIRKVFVIKSVLRLCLGIDTRKSLQEINVSCMERRKAGERDNFKSLSINISRYLEDEGNFKENPLGLFVQKCKKSLI